MKYITILLILFYSCKVTAQPPSLSSFSLAQQYQLKMYIKYGLDSVGSILQKNFYYQLYLRDKKIDDLTARIKKMEDSALSFKIDTSIKYPSGPVYYPLLRVIDLTPLQNLTEYLNQYMIFQKQEFYKLSK